MSRRRRREAGPRTRIALPTEYREPLDVWTQYSFHISGQKHIGKTTFASAGCMALIFQMDKPNIGLRNVLEVYPDGWRSPPAEEQETKRGFIDLLEEIEERAKEKAAGDADAFPWDRIVIDGMNKLYELVFAKVCKENAVDHPSDDMQTQSATWKEIRKRFTSIVERFQGLQISAQCGLVMISHCQWKDVRKSKGSKETVTKLRSDLTPQAAGIIDAKVHGQFLYDYDEEDRVLHITGSEEFAAGHNVDGHFRTKDGRRIRHIFMGNDADDSTPEKAFQNFLAAFENRQDYRDIDEYRARSETTKAKETTPDRKAEAKAEAVTEEPQKRRRRRRRKD